MMLQMKITTALIALNILLLLGIVGLNARSYLRMRAQYTLFLIVFSGLFLIESLVSGYFLFTHMDYYVPQVSNHILALTGLETVAFASLLWMQRQ
jgi:hypothetical protein